MTEPEVRLSTLVGDRICITCGFNLSGQPVVREPVYKMPIVRCPECSTVASLQEYPLLGRWAGRLASALAGLWLIVLMVFLLASAGAIFGLSQGHVATGSTKFARFLAAKHATWLETADAVTRQNVTQWSGGRIDPGNPYTWLDGTWWSKQDGGALLKEAGGIGSVVDWRTFGLTFWHIFNAFWIGVVWSVILLNMRRWRLLVFALLPIALALAFAYMANGSPAMVRGWGPGGSVYAINAAERTLWPWLIGIGLAIGLVSMWVGLWAGRTIVRWLARLLLPPRMLGSLAFLWIADGKRLPRPSPKTNRPVA